MQHIGVLIDFSELCLNSIAFAKTIAKRSNAKITLFHALNESESQRAKIEAKFKPYLDDIIASGLECAIEVAFGDYALVLPRMLTRSEVEFVVVGTHGVHGIKQLLFGSNILHLIQKLPVPTLVIQKDSPIPTEKGSKILFPMSPHANFLEEVLQTAKFSRIFNSKILVYTIIKSDDGPGEHIESNKKLACEEFKKQSLAYEVIDDPATLYSFGYGKQIVKYATENKIDLISIMSHVSSDLAIMGNADKERIILNEGFIPVLCVNN